MLVSKKNLVSAVLLIGVAGCQTYHRQPLDLSQYAKQWSDRSAMIMSVKDLAAMLHADPEYVTSFDFSDGLILAEAEAIALHFNPVLRLARARAEVPLASAKEAGWWPDPQFELEVLRFLDRGSKTRYRVDGPSLDGINSTGFETTPLGYRRVDGDYIDDPWIFGAGLSITIPLSGRLAVEKDLNWSQYSAAWRSILVQEWQLITDLRAAWLDWSTAGEKLRITRAYIEQLEQISSTTEQLVAAGEMAPTAARLFQLELAQRRADAITFEHQRNEKRHEVCALMGIAPTRDIAFTPHFKIPSLNEIPEDWQQRLVESHPTIQATLADYEAAEQQLRLEIRKQYPDLNLGPNYSLEEGLTRFGLGMGLSLPLWNRNRQAIAEAEAERQAARVRAEWVVEKVLAEFAQLQTRMDHATRRQSFLMDHLAPLVERQASESRQMLVLGEGDVLVLRDALTSSLDTKLDLLDAALDKNLAANSLYQMLTPRWATSLPSDVPESAR